jgi:myosin heavy subunit
MLARKQARGLRRQKAAVVIQTAWRRYKMRLEYQAMYHQIVMLQALFRGQLARKNYTAMRRDHAALVLQSNWRRHVHQTSYESKRGAAVVLQNAYR